MGVVTEVKIYPNKRYAEMYFNSFVEENISKIKKIKKRPYYKIEMVCGKVYLFLSEIEYSHWYKGRNYFINGNEYHSGERVK